MSASISVIPHQTGGKFKVRIDEADSSTEHEAVLEVDYFKSLSPNSADEKQFIEACFRFLLERESKEQILPAFNVKVIENYFPEFRTKVKNYL